MVNRHASMRRACAGAAGACLLCALGGCASPKDELAIGDRVYLEALTPQRAPKPFGTPLTEAGDAPSLNRGTLERGHWTVRAVLVPIDGTAHQPTYATGPSYARETARQRGEFPTMDSVLELGAREWQWSEVFEGLAWPFWAGADLALMPARMVMQPPWDDAASPPGPRGRAPEGTQTPAMLGAAGSGMVPVVGARPTVPPVEEPRWIWRGGKWYLWTPGDPEPWMQKNDPTVLPDDFIIYPAERPEAPPVQPEPASDVTKPAPVVVPAPVQPATPAAKPVPAESRPRGSGGWVFKDGKWVKTKPEGEAPKPAEPTEPKAEPKP